LKNAQIIDNQFTATELTRVAKELHTLQPASLTTRHVHPVTNDKNDGIYLDGEEKESVRINDGCKHVLVLSTGSNCDGVQDDRDGLCDHGCYDGDDHIGSLIHHNDNHENNDNSEGDHNHDDDNPTKEDNDNPNGVDDNKLKANLFLIKQIKSLLQLKSLLIGTMIAIIFCSLLMNARCYCQATMGKSNIMAFPLENKDNHTVKETNRLTNYRDSAPSTNYTNGMWLPSTKYTDGIISTNYTNNSPLTNYSNSIPSVNHTDGAPLTNYTDGGIHYTNSIPSTNHIDDTRSTNYMDGAPSTNYTVGALTRNVTWALSNSYTNTDQTKACFCADAQNIVKALSITYQYIQLQLNRNNLFSGTLLTEYLSEMKQDSGINTSTVQCTGIDEWEKKSSEYLHASWKSITLIYYTMAVSCTSEYGIVRNISCQKIIPGIIINNTNTLSINASDDNISDFGTPSTDNDTVTAISQGTFVYSNMLQCSKSYRAQPSDRAVKAITTELIKPPSSIKYRKLEGNCPAVLVSSEIQFENNTGLANLPIHWNVRKLYDPKIELLLVLNHHLMTSQMQSLQHMAIDIFTDSWNNNSNACIEDANTIPPTCENVNICVNISQSVLVIRALLQLAPPQSILYVKGKYIHYDAQLNIIAISTINNISNLDPLWCEITNGMENALEIGACVTVHPSFTTDHDPDIIFSRTNISQRNLQDALQVIKQGVYIKQNIKLYNNYNWSKHVSTFPTANLNIQWHAHLNESGCNNFSLLISQTEKITGFLSIMETLTDNSIKFYSHYCLVVTKSKGKGSVKGRSHQMKNYSMALAQWNSLDANISDLMQCAIINYEAILDCFPLTLSKLRLKTIIHSTYCNKFKLSICNTTRQYSMQSHNGWFSGSLLKHKLSTVKPNITHSELTPFTGQEEQSITNYCSKSEQHNGTILNSYTSLLDSMTTSSAAIPQCGLRASSSLQPEDQFQQNITPIVLQYDDRVSNCRFNKSLLSFVQWALDDTICFTYFCNWKCLFVDYSYDSLSDIAVKRKSTCSKVTLKIRQFLSNNVSGCVTPRGMHTDSISELFLQRRKNLVATPTTFVMNQKTVHYNTRLKSQDILDYSVLLPAQKFTLNYTYFTDSTVTSGLAHQSCISLHSVSSRVKNLIGIPSSKSVQTLCYYCSKDGLNVSYIKICNHDMDNSCFIQIHFLIFENVSCPPTSILQKPDCSMTYYQHHLLCMEFNINFNSNSWAETTIVDLQSCIITSYNGHYNLVRHSMPLIFHHHDSPPLKLLFTWILNELNAMPYFDKMFNSKLIDNQDKNLSGNNEHLKVTYLEMLKTIHIVYTIAQNLLRTWVKLQQCCIFYISHSEQSTCSCKESLCVLPTCTINEDTLTTNSHSKIFNFLSFLRYFTFLNSKSVHSMTNTFQNYDIFSEESSLLLHKCYFIDILTRWLTDNSFILPLNRHHKSYPSIMYHQVTVVRNNSTNDWSLDSLHALVCKNFSLQEFSILASSQDSSYTTVDDTEKDKCDDKEAEEASDKVYLWSSLSFCALFVVMICTFYALWKRGEDFSC